MSSRWARCAALLALLAATACSGSDDVGDDSALSSDTAVSTTISGSATEPVSSPPTIASSGTAGTVPVPSPDPASSVPPTTAGVAGVVPEGFELVAGRVTAADGEICDVCLWLAATPEQRGRGLMGVTDLGDGDGMVFRWDEPTTGNFWMRDTPQRLSIAFYTPDGAFVSASDMEPCLQPIPDAECPRYAAAGAYTYAVEVFAGGLPPLLMSPGSRLELLDGGCPATT